MQLKKWSVCRWGRVVRLVVRNRGVRNRWVRNRGVKNLEVKHLEEQNPNVRNLDVKSEIQGKLVINS